MSKSLLDWLEEDEKKRQMDKYFIDQGSVVANELTPYERARASGPSYEDMAMSVPGLGVVDKATKDLRRAAWAKKDWWGWDLFKTRQQAKKAFEQPIEINLDELTMWDMYDKLDRDKIHRIINKHGGGNKASWELLNAYINKLRADKARIVSEDALEDRLVRKWNEMEKQGMLDPFPVDEFTPREVRLWTAKQEGVPYRSPESFIPKPKLPK